MGGGGRQYRADVLPMGGVTMSDLYNPHDDDRFEKWFEPREVGIRLTLLEELEREPTDYEIEERARSDFNLEQRGRPYEGND